MHWVSSGPQAHRVHRKQLEGRLAEMVSEANAQIKRNAPEANVELLAQDYRRGLFSSQFNLQIKPVDGSENPWLKPGQSIVLHEVVDHGPLPLAQLKSFNLMPSMASVHTQLVNNDVTKALFEDCEGRITVYCRHADWLQRGYPQRYQPAPA